MDREQLLATLRLVRGHYEMAAKRLKDVEKLLDTPERAMSVVDAIMTMVDNESDLGHRMWVNLHEVFVACRKEA